MHIHQEVKFGDLGYITLDINYILFGVEACGEVLSEDLLHILVEHGRIGVSCKSVEVSDEIAAIIVILHSDELGEGAEIIAEVEIAGGTDAAKHNFFIIRRGRGIVVIDFSHR